VFIFYAGFIYTAFLALPSLPFFFGLAYYIKRKSLNSLQLTAGLWGNSEEMGEKKAG